MSCCVVVCHTWSMSEADKTAAQALRTENIEKALEYPQTPENEMALREELNSRK